METKIKELGIALIFIAYNENEYDFGRELSPILIINSYTNYRFLSPFLEKKTIIICYIKLNILHLANTI